MKKLTAIALAALTAVALTACEDDNGNGFGSKGANRFDLENVSGREPDRIEVLVNVDQHPNIVRLCIDGEAYYTVSPTHRVSPPSIFGELPEDPALHPNRPLYRQPSWDASFCREGAE